MTGGRDASICPSPLPVSTDDEVSYFWNLGAVSSSDAVSRALAIIAVDIATGSLAVAVLTYRRSAARLRAWAGRQNGPGQIRPRAEILAVCGSPQPRSRQYPDQRRDVVLRRRPEPHRFRLDGPQLPLRIEGNQTEHWEIPLVAVFRATRKLGIANTRIRAIVDTGSGSSLRTNWYAWPPQKPDGDPSPETLDRLRAAATDEESDLGKSAHSRRAGLGYRVSASTVCNVLRQADADSAPRRRAAPA
jgi:hypothetical protein